jgi:hypothetical protein
MLQKTIGSTPCCLEQIMSILNQVIYFSLVLMVFFIFNSLDEFYRAANESVALNGAPSVNNLPVRTQFRYSALPGAVEPLQILKSDKIDIYFQDDFKVSDQLRVTFGLRGSRVSFVNTAA